MSNNFTMEKTIRVVKRMKEMGKAFWLFENSGDKEKIETVDIEKIETNPFQPRKEFDEEKIDDLAQSIKTYGLLQPVIVRPSGKGYELVVGERRLMACKRLGWKTLQVMVQKLSDNAVATVALIENLQRENLTFMEEAEGYEKLINEFNLTQEVLAQRLGKSQSTIANKMRLLRFPDNVKKALKENDITERHARTLLKLEEEKLQLQVINEIVNKELNVKQTENLVENMLKKEEDSDNKKESKKPTAVVRDKRIFLNTIREALQVIEKAGLTPEVEENEKSDFYEVVIRLPK